MDGNRSNRSSPKKRKRMKDAHAATVQIAVATGKGGSMMNGSLTAGTQERNFLQMVERTSGTSLVCVGLDSDYEKIPNFIKDDAWLRVEDMSQFCVSRDKGQKMIEEAIFLFNKRIVDCTQDIVGAYKPNIAFYAKYGIAGLEALRRTIAYIKEYYPHVPIILDAKRGDIEHTNDGYMGEAFDIFGADALTVNPYVGGEALVPFLEQSTKGIIVLCRTSNKGSGEFQDLMVVPPGETDLTRCRPLYLHVAMNFHDYWNERGNCALVVGATYPEELGIIRKVVGNMLVLIPGVGKQGGDLKKVVQYGLDSNGAGVLINSSRGIIFAEDPRAEVEKLNREIYCYRKEYAHK